VTASLCGATTTVAAESAEITARSSLSHAERVPARAYDAQVGSVDKHGRRAVPFPCVSAVMPAFDEETTIEVAAERVLKSPWCAELIIVDDGSRDRTLEIARRLAEVDDRVHVVAHRTNEGKGAALRTGIGRATADVVIVQDADLEYDPADYDSLVPPILDNEADAVFGSRFVSSGPHRVLYFWHSIGNRLLTTLSNAFTNLNLTDMETGYKAFRREVIQAIPLEETRFGFEAEVTAKLARRHLRIYEVGISYHGRTYSEGKKIGWRDGVWALVCIAKYSAIGDRLRRRG
jgi:glycosyltransferase involved in cell wall biosynthesis